MPWDSIFCFLVVFMAWNAAGFAAETGKELLEDPVPGGTGLGTGPDAKGPEEGPAPLAGQVSRPTGDLPVVTIEDVDRSFFQGEREILFRQDITQGVERGSDVLSKIETRGLTALELGSGLSPRRNMFGSFTFRGSSSEAGKLAVRTGISSGRLGWGLWGSGGLDKGLFVAGHREKNIRARAGSILTFDRADGLKGTAEVLWEREGLAEILGSEPDVMRWSSLALGRAGFESSAIPLKAIMDLRFLQFPDALHKPELSRLRLSFEAGRIPLAGMTVQFGGTLGQEGVRFREPTGTLGPQGTGLLEETRPWYVGWIQINKTRHDPAPQGLEARIGAQGMKTLTGTEALVQITWHQVIRKPGPLGLALQAGYGSIRFMEKKELSQGRFRLRMDPSLRPEWVGPWVSFSLTRPFSSRSHVRLTGMWEKVRGLLSTGEAGNIVFGGQFVTLQGVNGTLVTSNGPDANVAGLGLEGLLRRGLFEMDLKYKYESLDTSLSLYGYRPAHRGHVGLKFLPIKWKLEAGLSFLGPRTHGPGGPKVSAAGFSRIGVSYLFSSQFELESLLRNPLGTDGPYQLQYPQKVLDFVVSLTGRF